MPAAFRKSGKVSLKVNRSFNPEICRLASCVYIVIKRLRNVNSLVEQLLRSKALAGKHIPNRGFRAIISVVIVLHVICIAHSHCNGKIAVFHRGDNGVFFTVDLRVAIGVCNSLAVCFPFAVVLCAGVDKFHHGVVILRNPCGTFGDKIFHLGTKVLIRYEQRLIASLLPEIINIPIKSFTCGNKFIRRHAARILHSGADGGVFCHGAFPIVKAYVLHRGIARLCGGKLSVIACHPLRKAAHRALLRLVRAENGVVVAAQRVFAGNYSLLCGRNAVNLDELDIVAGSVHIRRVCVDGIAD